jgi:hypothetical protein
MTGSWYNGYSWQERIAKFEEMKRRIDARTLEEPQGPCALCGDPGGGDPPVKFEYHDEDYSQDYRWDPPAAYVLCHDCHVNRLHRRFINPKAWTVFLAHVRRGGYARELKDPSVKRELASYRRALDRADPLPVLTEIRTYRATAGDEWFAHLCLDAESLTDPSARPRP